MVIRVPDYSNRTDINIKLRRSKTFNFAEDANSFIELIKTTFPHGTYKEIRRIIGEEYINTLPRSNQKILRGKRTKTALLSGGDRTSKNV